MNTTLATLLATLLMASPSSQADEPPAKTPMAACQGVKPLYDPGQATVPTPPLFSRGFGVMQLLNSLPVAFAASGDPCLGPVPVYRVSLHTLPVHDSHAMARLLAPEMAEISRRTGEETCARMCKTAQGTIVAQLVTLHAHVVCLAEENTCPSGSSPTLETIHSHPPNTAFIANAVDELGWEEPGINGKLTLTGYPDSLSPDDRAQAPVWLVGTRAQLIWLDTPQGHEIERP